MVGPHQAIVIANSQHRRQSLAALLRSMPEFGEICEAENVDLLQPPDSFHPELAVFDCWQGEVISQKILNSIRKKFQKVRCLALVRRNSRSTEDTDIDLTLMEGFTIDLFFDTIRHLLKSEGVV